jgi:hypothetical protein
VSRYGRPCDPQARPVGVGEHPQEDDIDQRDEQQDAPPSAVARLVQNLDDRQQINQQDDKADNPMQERRILAPGRAIYQPGARLTGRRHSWHTRSTGRD